MAIFGLMTKKDFDAAIENELEKRVAADALYDPVTGRGGNKDRARRLRGTGGTYIDGSLRELHRSNGLIQTVVNTPADDAVREWFKIEVTGDNGKIAALIQKRLEHLKIKKLLREAIKFSRINAKGSALFFGIKGDRISDQTNTDKPLPSTFSKIDFINLISNSDKFSIRLQNSTDATKKDYNAPILQVNHKDVHPSRCIWFCTEFDPEEKEGISVVQTIYDAICAQDSGLYSINRVLQQLQFLIVKDDRVANLPPDKKAEWLFKLTDQLSTNGAVAVDKEGSVGFTGQSAGNLKTIFEFIWENLGGVAKMPKNILLGKAHGVVTAGEYDTINYYDKIAEYQETELRPIIRQIIDLTLRETNGEIYKATNGRLDYKIKFNSLWKLSPDEQAKTDKTNAERDQIDINTGKISPDEARELDPRYEHLDALSAGEIPEDEEE